MELSLPTSIFLVYLASLCYVIASYYHLKYNHDWSLLFALTIAIPVVMIEYSFSLPANYALHKHHNFEPVNILIVTIIFYFINLWLLNYFILKKKVKNVFHEMIAISLVLLAFYITTVL
jgi:uncharacterized protein (DUF486 family)